MTLHSHASNYRGQRGPQSPGQSPADPLSRRDGPSDPTSPRFPLTDINNPRDIAQELSNLQALRRLSMDVGNNIDPDMPPMTLSAIPSLAPSGDDDENDPSRLLWVPARVHPELAPSEFKHFLENRVQSIRRRSGDSLLSPDGELSRSDSALKRRKSRLSQQIVSADVAGASFADSAARLGRERSEGRITPELSLEELVNDPTGAVQKLAHESQLQHTENTNPDDMPILPMAPGTGLRRSTRTTYRKGGSLRYGSGSKRTVSRQLDDAADNTSKTSPEASPRQTLDRVQSEPVNENFSRPNRSIHRPQTFSQEAPDALAALEGKEPGMATSEPRQPIQDTLPLRTASSSSTPGIAFDADAQDEYAPNDEQEYNQAFPKRTTSQTYSNTPLDLRQEHAYEEQQNPARDNRRSSNGPIYGSMPSQYMSKNQSTPQHQSLSEGLAASPTIPGGGNTRTDALTFIPTLSADDRKWEKKSKKEKDDDASSVSSKSSGWKWFKGSSDDKEKKKEKDENRRSKARAQAEKAQDNARLDVLQTSIEKSSSKARESLVLDRDSFDGKLQEERKKESRKSDVKKDKDSGLFSSLFGGSKKKDEKEKSSKKSQFLHVPEEPQPYKALQPDVDYNWTRFPLLEERAIYRMAHIKLANPRRPLLSQVLLSNFMYSYLAIVQAMHPQMNIPVSPQQKRLEEETRRKQQEDEYLAQQGMDGHDQAIDQYNFDYHRVSLHFRYHTNNMTDNHRLLCNMPTVARPIRLTTLTMLKYMRTIMATSKLIKTMITMITTITTRMIKTTTTIVMTARTISRTAINRTCGSERDGWLSGLPRQQAGSVVFL